MRAEIQRIQRDLAATTIYVTHDQVEAMTIGDRVARHARRLLQQVGVAAGALRPPGQPLRRGVHRLAGDEPASRLSSPRSTAGSRSRFRSGSVPVPQAVSARGPSCGVRGEERRPRDPSRGPRGRAAARLRSTERDRDPGRHPRGHGRGGVRPLSGRCRRRRDPGGARSDGGAGRPRGGPRAHARRRAVHRPPRARDKMHAKATASRSPSTPRASTSSTPRREPASTASR